VVDQLVHTHGPDPAPREQLVRGLENALAGLWSAVLRGPGRGVVPRDAGRDSGTETDGCMTVGVQVHAGDEAFVPVATQLVTELRQLRDAVPVLDLAGGIANGDSVRRQRRRS
jgi:hypothetical protein